MNYILLTIHLIAVAVALGGRIIFIPILNKRVKDGLNERLEGIDEVLLLVRIADIGLIIAFICGLAMYLLSGISLTETHWAFKLKLVTVLLLLTDIGAYHLAKMRVLNHYDAQMIPAIKRLNAIAVILLCCIVLFATFSG